MRRPAAVTALAGLVAASAVLLGGCSANAGLTQARQACAYVKTSITVFHRAEHDPDATESSALTAKAADELETALPLAAAANSANPEWNPLMTTLQEVGRIQEQYLVPALTAQCAVADSSNPQAPIVNPSQPGQPTPSTLPGQ